MGGPVGEGDAALADRLADAVHADALVALLDELAATRPAPPGAGGRGLVDTAERAVASIGRQGADAYAELSAGLAGAGVAHQPLSPPADVLLGPSPRLQRIALDVEVPAGAATDALSAATRLGYRVWYRLDRAAWAAYRRLYPALPLVTETPGGHPVLLRLVWRPAALDEGARSGPGLHARPRLARLGRLRPLPQDLEAVALPVALWPAHLALRPVRLARARLRPGTARSELGPYLPTPVRLIDALLDVAGAGAEDVLVDVGCGDGRLLVRAAAARGCRCLGVERDAELVERARAAAEAAGVGSRVRVVSGEASRFDLTEATVAVLFLDAGVLPAVVAELRARLRPGSRIVAHEQAPVGVPGGLRRPLFTDAGITVAHRWDV